MLSLYTHSPRRVAHRSIMLYQSHHSVSLENNHLRLFLQLGLGLVSWLLEPHLNSLSFHSQVLVLRELAVSAPTFFFQQVQPFFDNIFYAVWDSKQAIREGAVSALRACLILTTQRETKEMQKPQWYKVSSHHFTRHGGRVHSQIGSLGFAGVTL